ncbi:hypothetical protein AAVH_42403, partial [Aphelenchoides avenae]
VTGWISVGTAVGTAIASALVEVQTLIHYRRLTANQRKKLRNDYRLLVCAIFAWTGQLLMAFYYCLTYRFGESSLAAIARTGYPYLIDYLTLSTPIFLFMTGKSLRAQYLHFYGIGVADSNASTTSAVATDMRRHSRPVVVVPVSETMRRNSWY